MRKREKAELTWELARRRWLTVNKELARILVLASEDPRQMEGKLNTITVHRLAGKYEILAWILSAEDK